MAKDPAFLFYTSDFLTGTMFMDDAQVGQYIRLLCAQHQHGHLSEEQFKRICPGMDPMILEKFKRDEKGLLFNEKAEKEMTRRKTFTESRRKNLGKKSVENPHMEPHMEPHMGAHMESHMETETETITKTVFKGGVGEKWNQRPKPEDVPDIPDIKIGSAQELVYHTQRKKITKETVIGMFYVFKQQNLTGQKFYQTQNEVYSHFINWIKDKKFNESDKQNNLGKRTGLAALMDDFRAESTGNVFPDRDRSPQG